MKQFGKIFRFELKYYLKNKVFVGVTIALVALIAIVMFFPRISEVFGSSDGTEQKPIMLVKAPMEAMDEMVQTYFSETFATYDVKMTHEDTDAICESVREGSVSCAFVMTDLTEFTYYVENLSLYDVNCETAMTALRQIYQFSALAGALSPEQAQQIMNISITANAQSLGVDQRENFMYTYSMIMALYSGIVLYGQMVATNVATEKSSRAMELLITSADPTSMMFGKVLASCLAGLLQITAIFGTAILCYNLNKDYWTDIPMIGSIFNMPLELFGYMLIFFVLGFLIYGFLYGAIGSTASKLEDINTSVMPITMLFIVGFFVVVMAMTSGDVSNTTMVVCSYVPFTSSMAMFTRIAMSTVPWYEIAGSIGILAVSVVGIGFISAKIYRAGVLLYGTPPKFGQILKMIWKA